MLFYKQYLDLTLMQKIDLVLFRISRFFLQNPAKLFEGMMLIFKEMNLTILRFII